MTPFATVDELFAALADERPGDVVTALAHALQPLLGDRIAALVAGHVAAKRWLVTCDPQYRSRLSDNSRATLARQGESFTQAERAAFEASPHAADCILLRRADDEAKQPGRIVPSLDSWRALALDYASKR
jgi:predicted HD phosphohydrolase